MINETCKRKRPGTILICRFAANKSNISPNTLGFKKCTVSKKCTHLHLRDYTPYKNFANNLPINKEVLFKLEHLKRTPLSAFTKYTAYQRFSE